MKNSTNNEKKMSFCGKIRKSLHFHHWHHSPVHAVANARRCTDFTPLNWKIGEERHFTWYLHAQTHFTTFSARNTVELFFKVLKSLSRRWTKSVCDFKVAGELHQTIIIDLSLGRIGKKSEWGRENFAENSFMVFWLEGKKAPNRLRLLVGMEVEVKVYFMKTSNVGIM